MGSRHSHSPPPPPPRNCDGEINNIRNSYNEQINSLSGQINNLNRQLSQKQNEINGLTNELNLSKNSDKEHIRQLNEWRMKYNDAEKKIAELESEITSLEQQIEDLLRRIDNLKISAEVSTVTANAAINNLEKMTNMKDEPIREGLLTEMNDLVIRMNENNNVLHDAVSAQNDTLDKQIQDMKNQYTTDDQKTAYQLQENVSLNKINISLMLTYYALALVFFYVLYKSYKTTMSIYLMVFIFILVGIYPWVIGTIESFILFLWNYLSSVIHGNVYVS